MSSTNKTVNIGLNQWQGNEYPKRQDFVDDNVKIDTEIGNLKKDLSSHWADNLYQAVGGTATAITLTISGTLVTGYPITFIVSANNSGAATTINGKPLYKPGTTTSPTLIAGKAYTVWYNSASNCFFIKASAEGDVVAANVLAGKKFSNDNDTGLVGTAPLKSGITYTPTTSDQAISTGFEDGTCKVKGDANLIASNIASGKSIFGVNGTIKRKATGTGTTDSNATAIVTGLEFTPTTDSTIIIISNPIPNYGVYAMLYSPVKKYYTRTWFTNESLGVYNAPILVTTADVTLTQNGFRHQFFGGFGANTGFTWYVYE